LLLDLLTESKEHAMQKSTNKSRSFFDMVQEDDTSIFSSALASKLGDLLNTTPIPRLTGPEQRNMKAIIECVDEVNQQRRSMDENAARFVLFFKLYSIMSFVKRATTGLSWREINWGFHSESQ